MTSTPNHGFTVHVSGCTREQAEQVMSERIDPDEDLGFDYSIDWEAASSPAAGLVIDGNQQKLILKALKESLRDTQDDLASYPVPKVPRSKRLAAIREDLGRQCAELKALIKLVKETTPSITPKD